MWLLPSNTKLIVSNINLNRSGDYNVSRIYLWFCVKYYVIYLFTLIALWDVQDIIVRHKFEHFQGLIKAFYIALHILLRHYTAEFLQVHEAD